MTEKAYYGIRSARRPQKGHNLSGVVQVVGGGSTGFVYISFSEKLVDAVGMLLPEGVSKFRPAYLRLVKWSGFSWRLYAKYLEDGSVSALVAEYDSCPTWAVNVRSGHGAGKKGKGAAA